MPRWARELASTEALLMIRIGKRGTRCAFRTLLTFVTALCAVRLTAQELALVPNERGVEVTVDGAPFASYEIRSRHQPVIWPIIGPEGQAMTRQFPLGEPAPGEKVDHPHHRSLWFNHGSVNGIDFWAEPPANEQGVPQHLIRHREFSTIESVGDVAKLVAVNDWLSNGKKVCEDERTILFGADEHGRWIDVTILVKASEGPLVFGDTKEGSFGIRVPGALAVDSEQGGEIRNSRGDRNDAAWGRAAEWVDYHGVVDGKPVGIAVFDMPDSFRHPTRWHVRTYGLFAANPFGDRDFPAGKTPQGEAKLAQGEQLRLHYRVLLYSGALTPAELEAIYRKYRGD